MSMYYEYVEKRLYRQIIETQNRIIATQSELLETVVQYAHGIEELYTTSPPVDFSAYTAEGEQWAK